jgi:deoxyhypusine synthase
VHKSRRRILFQVAYTRKSYIGYTHLIHSEFYVTTNTKKLMESQEAVLRRTQVSENGLIIKGLDLDQSKSVDYGEILNSFMATGIQASQLAMAMEQIDKMLDWSLADEPVADDEDEEFVSSEVRKNVRCRVWLSYTSNMISSGCREYIKYLCKHKMVQAIVTTAGGIEEDFVKCLTNHHLGSFSTPGKEMRAKGLNRIGNMVVPNDNYCDFEDWLSPILDQMWEEQVNNGVVWTPSKIINRLGKEIDNEDSVYYWCWKNDIPVFCPALTDGSLGDMLYFHTYKKEGFTIDIVRDIRAINDLAIKSRKSGAIIIGGSVPKHHVLNANLMRNGVDYAVYINTGQAFDASDSGANPDEAVSWGKIRYGAKPVKVSSEATLVFPFIVARCFAEREKNGRWSEERKNQSIFEKQVTFQEREKDRLALAALAEYYKTHPQP